MNERAAGSGFGLQAPRTGGVVVPVRLRSVDVTRSRLPMPVNLTATSANVSESGSPVKIVILRWSTDEERNPVVAALTPCRRPADGPVGGGLAPSWANPSAAAGGGRREVAPVRHAAAPGAEAAAAQRAEAVAMPGARPIPSRP